MMLSKVESGKNSGEDSSSGRLLRDIEEISKALYVQNPPPKGLISPSGRRSKSAGKTRFLESKSNFVNEDLLKKDKKSSLWNWKPLKALTHIRNNRFNCCFFLHVHAIEGLPSNFNDLSLCVNWKRKDEVLRTRPARVCQGVAEFEETLMHRCSVYGSKSGSHHSAKYKSKLFLLYASVLGAPGQDVGKHWIDLTRLLPLNLEELEEEKRSSGKWMTSFKLAGKAKGAMMNVSFGFSVFGDSLLESSSSLTVPDALKVSAQSTAEHFQDFGRSSGNGMLRRLGSVPKNSNHATHLPARSLDIKVLNDVFPNRALGLTQSITFLYQKLDDGKLGNSEEFNFFDEHLEPLKPKPCSSPESGGENSGNESDDTEFTVIEQGIEFPVNDQLKLEEVVQSFDDSVIETIDMAEIFKGDGTALDEEIESNSKDEAYGNLKDEIVVDDNRCIENVVCTKEPTIEELGSVLYNLSIAESVDLDSSLDESTFLEQENYMETKSSHKGGKMIKSLSFDDVTESVANDFLNMLGIEQSSSSLSPDSEPESPRECLLRQFEKESLASGNSIFYCDAIGEMVEFTDDALTSSGWGDYSVDFDLSLVIQAAEEEHDRVSQSLRSRREAKILENLETEALMREWGLNEKAFQNSPRSTCGGFGSPVYISPEEPPELPPLGQGLGTTVRTKGGGFLRSMNPSLFRNTKNGENLIMQVSGPIVLPAAMGSSGMEILQCWALVGVEKMAMQANELMPLEDITGKTMQQVAWEAASRSEVLERWCLLLQESVVGDNSFIMSKKVEESHSSLGPDTLYSRSESDEIESGYVFLENLAPLAMDKIEALSIEGLRIQSGLSEEEAPSSIRLQSIGTASLNKIVQLGGSFSFKGDGDEVDELIGLSISLDEWMRLDAGIIGDDSEISDQISRILAAHCAKHVDLINGRLTRDGKCGLLGNNFTIALKMHLRDPLRNYETVGTSMLALIQVERVFVPLKSDVYRTVSETSYNGKEYNVHEQLVESGINVRENDNKSDEEEGIPRFKITEVHVAGLNPEPGKKQLWGTRTQQQSGSRWLLSSGLGKTNKHPFLKSNAIVRSSTRMMRQVRPGDTLWSISSHVNGAGAKWKELVALNLHIRNPDIVFLDETIRFPLE